MNVGGGQHVGTSDIHGTSKTFLIARIVASAKSRGHNRKAEGQWKWIGRTGLKSMVKPASSQPLRTHEEIWWAPRNWLNIRLLCLKQWQKKIGSQKNSKYSKIFEKIQKIVELKILDGRWCQHVRHTSRQVAVNFTEIMKRKWRKRGPR
jgi:hypothetical protein